MDILRIDSANLRAWLNEKEVDLTLNEWRLLLIFHSDPSNVFSSGELARRLQIREIGIYPLIFRLRKKLNQGFVFHTPSIDGYTWRRQ